jgi:hypothetical protein
MISKPVEMLKLRGLFWPAQGRERPKRGAEPGVQHIGILPEPLAAASRAPSRIFFSHYDLPAILAIPDRNPVSPPQLPGNAPIPDVLHPVEVQLGKAAGNEFHPSFPDSRDGWLCQRLHLHKPLFGQCGLHRGLAARTAAHGMLMPFDSSEQTFLLEIADQLTAAFIPI